LTKYPESSRKVLPKHTGVRSIAQILETYDFTVLKAFAPYFINGDLEGLDPAEIAQLEAFEARNFVLADAPPNVTRVLDHTPEDFDDTWFTTDDVTGLKGDCFTLRLQFMG